MTDPVATRPDPGVREGVAYVVLDHGNSRRTRTRRCKCRLPGRFARWSARLGVGARIRCTRCRAEYVFDFGYAFERPYWLPAVPNDFDPGPLQFSPNDLIEPERTGETE